MIKDRRQKAEGRRQRTDSGFSLLEIMVAIAILAVSTLVLIDFQGRNVVLAGRSEKYTLGAFLAREKIAEIQLNLEKDIRGGVFPDDRSENGKFEEPYENFSWKFVLRKVELPVPSGGGGGNPMELMFKMVAEQIAQSVREVRLTIVWDELGKEQSFDVVTHITKM